MSAIGHGTQAGRTTLCWALPPPLPERASEVAGVSSFMKAASIAWLKEFWKLGTGTRSELSLSPSLSIVAGGTKLFSSKKQPVLQFQEQLQGLGSSEGKVRPCTGRARLTFLWDCFGPRICFCFSNSQHLPTWEREEKESNDLLNNENTDSPSTTPSFSLWCVYDSISGLSLSFPPKKAFWDY